MENSHSGLPVLAIVVPCYCDAPVIDNTNTELLNILANLTDKQLISPDSYIMYVDDGSTDDSRDVLEILAERFPGKVAVLALSSNVGQQKAIAAGLEQARTDADMAVSIDADLQDDPSAIESMVRSYHKGAEVVFGVRRSRRADTGFKRWSALSFYKLMKMLGAQTVYNHADFRLMSKKMLDELARYPERNLFLRGIVPIMGFRQDIVYYDRCERKAGKSKYTLARMLAFAADGITSFSIKPVRMVLFAGLIFMVVALGIGIYVMIRHFSGHTIAGWTSMVLSVWFCSGMILVALGVVGEYIGKIYNEVKQRPRYHIDSFRRLKK